MFELLSPVFLLFVYAYLRTGILCFFLAVISRVPSTMDCKFNHWKFILILLLLLPFVLGIPLLINRGLHGEYVYGVHGISILIIGMLPFLCLFFFRSGQIKFPFSGLFIFAAILATGLILYYLSSNGLWCAQHPSVTREMCAKLKQFALFASTSNLRSWWLTLGDLLAIQRGRNMPMPWEHDVDVCITPEEYPRFEEALASRAEFFEPKPIHYEKGHWYLPIDLKKLGLRAREAEGVFIDVWTCPKKFKSNFSRVLYCNGYVNVPESTLDRHELLTKEYGDYSVVTYEHHDRMCRIWNG